MSIIHSVTDRELPATLAIALSVTGSGRPADPQHVRSFVDYLDSCSIPWRGIRMERSGKVTGVAFALLPPGRTAILMFPAPGELGTLADDQLGAMQALLGELRDQRLHYAQALVEPGVSAKSRLLERIGFWHLAELNYKERDASFPWVEPPTCEDASWISYTAETHAEFSATIEATYADSGDCPRLNGLRPIEDVIASHRATGKFDPALWQLARAADGNVGCLLLSRLTHGPLVELVYMGVMPAFRRRRFGSILLRRALELCRQARVGKLTLVVDASNEAAARLYERFDFQQVTARDAYLYQWACKSANG